MTGNDPLVHFPDEGPTATTRSTSCRTKLGTVTSLQIDRTRNGRAISATPGPPRAGCIIFELCQGTAHRIGDGLNMRWSSTNGDGILVHQSRTGAALWVPMTLRLQSALDATPRPGLAERSVPMAATADH